MKKKFLIIIAICCIFTLTSCKASEKGKEPKKVEEEPVKEEPKEKVDIIDVESDIRPYAIVVNNTPVAVKVQEGLNKAYIVYEIPTEGNTSRLLALFRDVDDVIVGTIRSVRHNFIDFAYESNAILVGFGWSHYAEMELSGGNAIINNMNGMVDDYPYWRNNPENLASEHTAYTNTTKIKEYASKKGFSSTGKNTVLLNYDGSDVDLSKKESAIPAKTVTIPYGSITTTFEYHEDTKMYYKNVNNVWITDYSSKENITTKNIIVEKITSNVINYNDVPQYLNLHDVGSGDGYYITNGYAVPIKWSKADRKAQTKYTYLDGTEIEVSDGRTYIEVQLTNFATTIK